MGMSLLSTLDDEIAAVQGAGGSPEAQFDRMRGPLEHFLRNPAVDLSVYQAKTSNLYARYLVSDPALPIELVLAVWRPGADSPIHDHDGLTGAVGLLAGALVETKYELRADGDRFKIHWQGGGSMQKGLASPIFPDGLHQVHRMYNAGVQTAFTLHVYLGKLRRVNRYFPDGDDRLRAESRDLWFDG